MGDRGEWGVAVRVSVGWGDKVGAGWVGRLGQSAGPLPSWAGQLGHRWPSGGCLFLFLVRFVFSFYLFHFSVLFHFNIFRHFQKGCSLHYNHLGI